MTLIERMKADKNQVTFYKELVRKSDKSKMFDLLEKVIEKFRKRY